MSRPLRIQYPGAWYHVMNRGRRAEAIFLGKKDYGIFIDLLKEAVDLWNVNGGGSCRDCFKYLEEKGTELNK